MTTPKTSWPTRLRKLRATLSPTCREMCSHTSHAMEQDLRFGQRLGYWIHLALCRTCRRYRQQLGWLRRSIRRLGPGENTRHRLSSAAKTKIKVSLRGGA